MSEIPKLPDFDGLSPKQMRRAWLRFMADHLWNADSQIYIRAEWVMLSIDMLILNVGDAESEEWCMRKIKEELATFSQIWAVGRG